MELTLPSGVEWLGPLLTGVKGWELLGPNGVAHLQEKLGVQHFTFQEATVKEKVNAGKLGSKKMHE